MPPLSSWQDVEIHAEMYAYLITASIKISACGQCVSKNQYIIHTVEM